MVRNRSVWRIIFIFFRFVFYETIGPAPKDAT